MQAKPNPKLKPSGVEWLGDVPEHWVMASLRWTSRRYSGGTPDRSNDAYWDDGDIPWVNSGAVNQGLITEPSAFITHDGFLNSSAKWVPKGALVMALAGQGKTKGMVAQLEISTTCNQSMAAIVPDDRIVPRFLFWWLSAQYNAIRNLAGGEQRDGLNLDILGSLPVALFPTKEQGDIVDFLDRETAKIDTLVTKKQELIEKLKEKRAALISRTVTHGLPPDAARAAGLDPKPNLKSSGIDWLGEVPAHWEVMRIKHVGSIRYGLGEPPEYVDDGLPFIRATDIKRGKIDLTIVKRVRPDDVPWSRNPLLKFNEILVVRSGAYTGDSALVTNEVAGCLAGYDMVLTVSNAHAPFIAWVLLSRYMLEGQIYLERLRAAQPHLNAEELGGFVLLLPPEREQQVLAGYLDRETAKLDAMTEKVETAIERLQEYRTALITAAVTGKIDVHKEAA